MTELVLLADARQLMLPSAFPDCVGLCNFFTGLNHTARALAVYASSSGRPMGPQSLNRPVSTSQRANRSRGVRSIGGADGSVAVGPLAAARASERTEPAAARVPAATGSMCARRN